MLGGVFFGMHLILRAPGFLPTQASHLSLLVSERLEAIIWYAPNFQCTRHIVEEVSPLLYYKESGIS